VGEPVKGQKSRETRKWPTWLYLALFLGPASVTFVLMAYGLSQELLFSAITALAIMNGSINSVIAYMTIRLDGHSNEALEHLETIMTEMDKLEDTLDDANKMVTDFTGDLDEAKELFGKVGVDLKDLDLDSVADVVERIKENKGGINSILDNLRDVDVAEYINQAKRINWKQLLGAAEEIMGFIQARNGPTKPPLTISPTLPSSLSVEEPDEEPLDLPEDEDLEWAKYRDSQYIPDDYDEDDEEEDEMPRRTLVLEREPRKKMPTPTLKRDSAPRRSLSRR